MKKTIKRHPHFKFVMNTGSKTVLKTCIIYTVPINIFTKKFKSYTGKNYVYGIMTTKKLGNAVMRNIIKRRLRVAIQSMNLLGHAYVFIGRKSVSNLPMETIIKGINTSKN
ncbi:MAG: ribonuclease P protein component [Candidatus Deianiraeaceae bacterium]|jgi:ribonuclease P protein component